MTRMKPDFDSTRQPQADTLSGGSLIAEVLETDSPLLALIRTTGLRLSLAPVVGAFQDRLGGIFAGSITGRDHREARVPLYFGKGPGPHDFFVATTPEGDPRTPQRRLEYTLAILDGDNLVARRTSHDGDKRQAPVTLGQGRFSDTRREIEDVFAAVLCDIRQTFSPEEKPAMAVTDDQTPPQPPRP